MNVQKMARLSLLISLATVLSILENQFVMPIAPWLKLGLANIMTLIALQMYGMSSAITVSCVRALLASIFGSLPMLVFSFSSAFTSSIAMGVLYLISHNKISIIGISVIGAVIHNITQLFIAYIVLKLSISSLLFLSPLLIISATIAGIITGLIARYINNIIKHHHIEKE